jgi:hypothetical protein
MVCVEAAEGRDFDGDDGFDDSGEDLLPGFEGGVVLLYEGGVIDDLEIVGFRVSGDGGGGGVGGNVHRGGGLFRGERAGGVAEEVGVVGDAKEGGMSATEKRETARCSEVVAGAGADCGNSRRN